MKIKSTSNFYKRMLSVFFLMFIGLGIKAQVSLYTFSQSSGTYTAISGGTVIGTEINDDNSFNALQIGFPFCFNGANYTTFSLQNNGFIAFGNTITSSYTNISTGTSNNAVHVMNFDLQSQIAGGELRYQTIGVYPNRTLVIQFKNYRGYLSVGDNLNFQIRLNETSNTIDCVYGSCVMGATSRQAQVGLRGNSNADFNNRSVLAGTNTWLTSTAGGTNAAYCDMQIATVPPTGLTYTWTPPAPPVTPTALTFTAVATTGMTLNWNDASTDEINFFIFRSLDGVNYTQVGTVTSVSTATTGTPYNFIDAGLANGTLYYYQVVAASGASCSMPLSGSQSTLPGTMCGTFTVGPTGAYTSLTAAFAAVVTNGVSCPLVFDLQPAYVSTVETFPLIVPSLGANATNTITVRPQLGATNLSITSGATQTLQFSGSSYVTFDGRPGSTGSVIQLTISNTSTTGSAVSYINDARNNTLKYLNITGVTSSTTNGVVSFGNSLTVEGNSNNTITLCDLSDGATTPNNMIYSNNTTGGAFNTANVISNNTISDFFSATLASNGIFLNTSGNSMWTITGNSLYQTAARIATTANNHTYINITNTVGSGYTVTNNFLGGSAASCGGTAATYSGAVATRMNILWVNCPVGTSSTITNNTVRNFNLTTTSGATVGPGIFTGFYLQGTGNYVVSGNTVGSTTANNDIVTTTSTSGGSLVGITSTCSGNTSITGSTIGGLTSNSSAVTVSSSVMGMYFTTGRNTISSNLIGSATQNNSLINASSTSATAGNVVGIQSGSAQTSTFSSNTVSNLTNQYAGASTTAQARGIVATSGINTITQNTISAIASLAPNTSIDANASVIGISASSVTTGQAQEVSGNTITGLANLTPTANVSLAGIYFTGGTIETHQIYKNTISAMGSTSTGTAIINGINIFGGTGNYYNNFIALGLDILGAPLVNAHEYNGIRKATTANNTIYFNSVHITGSGVAAGTGNSSAFRRTATGADVVQNNIFSNTRSNAAGGGSHYAINLNATTTFICDKNNYWGNGTGYVMGIVGATPYATFPAWKVATLLDANSFHTNPMFVSNTNLHINNPGISALESRGAVIPGITTDIDNQTRPGPTGSINGGGTIPDIGADEFDGFPINIDVGVSSLITPSSGCPSDTVRYALKNYAGVALNLATNPVTIVAYTTGVNPQAFPNTIVNSGTIAPGGTMNVVVSTTYNMSVAGTYTFRGYTQLVSDLLNDNDSLPISNFVVSGGIATSARSIICEFDSSLVTVAGYTNGGSVQWQSSPDNISWSNIVGANSPTYMTHPTATTYYRAIICGLQNSVSDTVIINTVLPPTTIGATRCGTGVVNLSASGSGTLNWYNNPVGGAVVNQGTTYSPTVSTTTSFYVSNATGVSNGMHTTTYAAGNGSAGNAFTVKALNTITITGFDGHTSITGGTQTWEIWYRPNDYLLTPGSQLSSVGWTQLAVVPNVTNAGPGIPTVIPVTLSLTIPAGATYSFEIFCGGSVSYTNGTVLGALFNQNTDMQVFNGHGGTAWAGMVNQPRVFNGRIHYSSGCESARVPVLATVTPAPTVTASAGATTLCGSDSTLLVASSSNSSYAYTWTPATFLSNTNNDSTMFVPSSAGVYTYYVDAFDAGSGCATRDTVTVGSYPRPVFTLATTNDTICSGSSTQLNAVLPPASYQVTNSNVLNTTTTYPAPYGNWYGGARHQMLILASELTAAGMTAGSYDAMTFQVVSIGTSAALQNLTIEMAMTNATAITTFQTLPFTTVYTNALYSPNVGVNTHIFSTPFFWDGVSNIIVQTCFNNLTFTENCVMRQATTAFNSTVYYRNDNEPGVCSNNAVTGFIMQRPNMSFRRSTSNFTYAWTPAASLLTPANDTTMATPMTSTMYYLTVTDGSTGCTKTDSIQIHVDQSPMPMLGADTVICSNAVLTLDGSAGTNYSYLWSTTDTTQTISVSSFGNYDVYVLDTITGCSGRDTVLVGVNIAPSFSLGSDVVVCAGNAVTFSGPAGTYDYLWSNADTTQSISTAIGASYDLLVTDTINGCFNSDTVLLTVNALPVVSLGADSTTCSANGAVILTAPAGGYTYIWSDLSTNDSLSVTFSGTYYLDVTDMVTGCIGSDTTVITINTSPVVALGNDTTMCGGSISLDAQNAGSTYVWSDASSAQTLNATTTGTYYVDVTSPAGCPASDTINVTINAVPVVALGNDTMVCGSSLLLDAGNAGATYLWSDASTAQTNTVSASGSYYVDVTNGSGCAASDTIMVTINTPPTVTFNIAPTTICLDDAALTLTGSPSGGVFSGPGVSGSTFTPLTAGNGNQTITYTYTDVNGCTVAVTDNITVSPCVGIDQPFISAGMNVYPNPNNGQFTFTIGDANYSELSVQLVTVEGKIVYSNMASDVKGNFAMQIDLREFANGVYFLRVVADGQTFVQKVVKGE